MNEAEPMVTSMWAFMASWFTPTVLFCVLNLMIGTIFIISNLKNQNKHQQQQLGEDNSPQLVRTPSLLERVKSFNLSFYRSESFDPFQPMAHHPDPTHDRSEDQTLEGQSQNPKEDLGLEGHVTRRSKSEMGGKSPAMVEPTMKKSASEKTVAAEEVEVDVDRRRPATVRERKGKWRETASSGGDETVDAKADDFINSFKKQLKLQRLDSLLRYNEMLNRGAGR